MVSFHPIMLGVCVVLVELAASNNTFIVPLGKQDVPVTVNGRVVAHKTAYFGNIFVGLPQPQNFTVVFDTGSGHLFLPSTTCKDESCALHRRYDRDLSASAVDVNHDGGVVALRDEVRDQASIAYGTGEIVGEFVREIVCVGFPAGGTAQHSLSTNGSDPENCARVRIITAREMTPEPFKNFVFDGVLGLGLGGLALDPEFHFLGQTTKNAGCAPVFGVFLAPWRGGQDADRSEIMFGGHDATRINGPLTWVPVEKPESGYWKIRIMGIRVGDERLPLCDDNSCTTILDTGTSMLGVPRVSLQDILWRTARTVDDQNAGTDCRDVPGPSLVFELEGGVEVRLEAEDYSRPAPSSVQVEGSLRAICRSSLLPIDMPALGEKVFIWGEPMLRKYYTVYDAQEPPRVGFAPAAAASARAGNGVVRPVVV